MGSRDRAFHLGRTVLALSLRFARELHELILDATRDRKGV